MAKPVKRLRYFDGLFLREEEFNEEQEHYTRMRRLHNRHLHGDGIVYGLDVTAGPDADSVTISQGMALDRYFDTDIGENLSRELIIVNAEPVSLQQYDPAEEVWLWIAYGESQADADAGGNPTRYEEIPQILHGTTMPTGDENIILARIVMPTGSITSSDIFDTDASSEPIRKLAGFQGGSVSTDTLILTDDDFGTNPPTLDGFYWSGTDDRGVKFNSDRTQFSGDVEIDETLTVTQDATFSANISGDGAPLSISGAASISSNATVGGTLGVTGATTLSSTLAVTGNTTVGGTLTIQSTVAVDEVSDDETLGDASATAIPTERAVREYVESLLVGSIAAFAMEAADVPNGWLMCDGTAVNRTTYARLFGKIDTMYGNGDGTTTFNLPDLRGEFIRGWADAASTDPDKASRTDRGDGTTGNYVGTKQGGALEDHDHTSGYSDNALEQGNTGSHFVPDHSGAGTGTLTGTVLNATASTETRPRNVAMIYCIKT